MCLIYWSLYRNHPKGSDVLIVNCSIPWLLHWEMNELYKLSHQIGIRLLACAQLIQGAWDQTQLQEINKINSGGKSGGWWGGGGGGEGWRKIKLGRELRGRNFRASKSAWNSVTCLLDMYVCIYVCECVYVCMYVCVCDCQKKTTRAQCGTRKRQENIDQIN